MSYVLVEKKETAVYWNMDQQDKIRKQGKNEKVQEGQTIGIVGLSFGTVFGNWIVSSVLVGWDAVWELDCEL